MIVPIGVTAILPDGLNTAWGDQAIARKHVIRYLQTIQPDDRITLYALGRELRVLHDYSSDPSALAKVLAGFTGRQRKERDS